MERFKIKVLYEDIECVLNMNGCLCKPFKVTQGIRQGCSMSGMLYTISIEPMLQNVLLLMVWFYLILARFILSACADDIIVIVRNQEEVRKLGKLVETFGKVSTLSVARRVKLEEGRLKVPGSLSRR